MLRFDPSSFAVLALFVLASACGYSDEEMAAKQREIDKLTQALHASTAACAGGGVEIGPSAPPVQQQVVACGRDVDCKGDRICRDGACHSPN